MLTFEQEPRAEHFIPLVGAESCMWASDYPHTDSTFPHSRQAIEDALGALPEDQLELIGLAYFEGKSNRAIAHSLGLSVATVRRRLRVALKNLNSYLTNRGGTWAFGAWFALDSLRRRLADSRPGWEVVSGAVAVAVVVCVPASHTVSATAPRVTAPASAPIEIRASPVPITGMRGGAAAQSTAPVPLTGSGANGRDVAPGIPLPAATVTVPLPAPAVEVPQVTVPVPLPTPLPSPPPLPKVGI
jgi:hypothetical protein